MSHVGARGLGAGTEGCRGAARGEVDEGGGPCAGYVYKRRTSRISHLALALALTHISTYLVSEDLSADCRYLVAGGAGMWC
jgi:hypothetical protein